MQRTINAEISANEVMGILRKEFQTKCNIDLSETGTGELKTEIVIKDGKLVKILFSYVDKEIE